MDIRAMSKQDLDNLNARAQLWRERQGKNPPAAAPVLDPVQLELAIEEGESNVSSDGE
jgi:hypothetical protein